MVLFGMPFPQKISGSLYWLPEVSCSHPVIFHCPFDGMQFNDAALFLWVQLPGKPFISGRASENRHTGKMG